MNDSQPNLTINETNMITSRRNFLTRMAYGSLLAMGGTSIAQAAAKHITHTPPATHKKVEAKSQHASNSSHAHTPVKNVLHERLALKTEHNAHHGKGVGKADRHPHELAANSHNHSTRVHSSLHKDSHGKYRLQQEEHHQLASRDAGLHRYSAPSELERDMPEFASEEDLDMAPRYSGQLITPNNITRNSFSLPRRFGNNNEAYKSLSLQNMTTGDSLDVTYFERGQYLPDALEEINYIYRDHLTDEIHPIDTALLDQLHELQATLGVKKEIHVICGYRSPFTNAYLRRRSSGVARNSLHMQGRAIDIRIAGVDTRDIRDAALSMALGGVGYYAGSDFVHLDTGDVRTW